MAQNQKGSMEEKILVCYVRRDFNSLVSISLRRRPTETGEMIMLKGKIFKALYLRIEVFVSPARICCTVVIVKKPSPLLEGSTFTCPVISTGMLISQRR